jgi:hypothetical protein
MIRKSVQRFSEKIMLNQKPKARWRFNPMSSRFSACLEGPPRGSPSRHAAIEASSAMLIQPVLVWRQTSAAGVMNLRRRIAKRVVFLACASATLQ